MLYSSTDFTFINDSLKDLAITLTVNFPCDRSSQLLNSGNLTKTVLYFDHQGFTLRRQYFNLINKCFTLRRCEYSMEEGLWCMRI